MSQLPNDMVSFVGAITGLAPWQKGLVEKLSKSNFSSIEQRILAHMPHPLDRSGLDDVILGVDWADGVDRTAMVAAQLRGDGVMVILDDLMMVEYKTVPASDIYKTRSTPFRNPGLIDELLAMEARLPPLAQEEPEPRARNGAKASKKTERAKAKLPFYLKNRRF
jgi:hypothetical protein